MACDPKQLVAAGYDWIAHDYLRRHGMSAVRDRWLDELIGLLPASRAADVLDLGCGAGLPVARRLAAAGHRVLGIDGSARQLELARGNVPDAEFRQADMTMVDLPTGYFDAVAAFYSITHVPAAEHSELLRRIARWLKPGGVLIASFGAGARSDWTGQWLGTEMFFGHNDEATTMALLQEAGLVARQAEVVTQDDENVEFLWVVATSAG